MVEKTTLHFSVSGKFITDLARTWFWDEHRPIQAILDLLNTCLGDLPDEEKLSITQEILEGKKKLEGNNIFQLVPDEGPVRSIFQYAEELQKEHSIATIRQDMISSYRKYVDPWSTVKSLHPEALACNSMPYTWNECRTYFTMQRKEYPDNDQFEELKIGDTFLIDTPTAGGLWLNRQPDLVYNACHGDLTLIGKPEFWSAVYEIIKDDPDFHDRNQRYLFSLKPKPSYEERMAALERMEQNMPKEPEIDETYLSPAWFVKTYTRTREPEYNMLPDPIERWEGLIAPNGDFYSVTFGGHNLKAYYLIHCYPTKFPNIFSELPSTDSDNPKKQRIAQLKAVPSDKALDLLIEAGWCATRSVLRDDYLLPPLPKKPTKAQIETILTAAEKHKRHIDANYLLSYL